MSHNRTRQTHNHSPARPPTMRHNRSCADRSAKAAGRERFPAGGDTYDHSVVHGDEDNACLPEKS